MKRYVVLEKGALSGDYIAKEFANLDAAYAYFMQDRVNRIIYRKLEVTLGEKNV